MAKKDSLEAYVRNMLSVLGEDVEREGIKETPRRIAEMYMENFYRLRDDTSPPEMTKFPNEKYNDLILVDDIDFTSFCEHHLLPFFGRVNVAYIPNEYYCGISKFGRVLDYFSAKPQIQERLTHEVIDYIWNQIKPQGIMIIIEAKHTCMTQRGAKKKDSLTTTSAIRGDIPKDEVLDLIQTRGDK